MKSWSKSLLLFAVSSVWTVQAQNPDSIVLNVTVTTKKGVLTRGLKMENFSVTADQQALKVLSLSEREVPASIGILIDDSGSRYIGKSKYTQMFDDQFREALDRFLKMSNPANEYFVVTFNSKVQLVQDWTSDAQAVVGTLNSLTFKKQTSLYDAMKLGLEKVQTGRNAKRILLLVSDGDDNNSKASFKEVRDALKASDVVLYCIGISNDLYLDDGVFRNREGFKKLDEFSSATGGRGLFTTNAAGPRALNEVFELIALELRNHYQLVIAPDHSGSKAKWWKLRINAQRGSEQLLARTRLWYFK